METTGKIQLATVPELVDILHERVGHNTPANGDEVYNGILVGDIFLSASAVSPEIVSLQKRGVTHVLNCAEQNCGERNCDTGADYYVNDGISYMGITAADNEMYPLMRHFDETTAFIDAALKVEGKVLVHCAHGYSRSPAIVIAYLIKNKGMPVREAVRGVRSRRFVGPNSGFLKQLCELKERLVLARTSEMS